MKSVSPKRGADQISIPEGHYVESISLNAGRFPVSPCLKYRLAYFKIHVNAAATITFKDHAGNQVAGMLVDKGMAPYLMSEISACDQTFFIVHDGAQAAVQKEMTSKNYPNGNS